MLPSVEAVEITCKEKEELEFKWLKKRGRGGKTKEVQFYESFTFDGVDYMLYDCVYMHKEGEPEPYIGKLIKIWEHPDKSKKVKVQWFFRPCEISNFLKDKNVVDNEIFLASGQGIGLANVNPLEAIAGKCNVICTSKDSRNLQPSEVDLGMADYVFYRTFDVGSCSVVDKIDDKVGDLDVKFVFNREENLKAIGSPNIAATQIQDYRNAALCNETAKLYGKNACKELATLNSDGNHARLAAKPKEEVDVQNLQGNRGSSSGDAKTLLVPPESMRGSNRSIGDGAGSSKGNATINVIKGVSNARIIKKEIEADKDKNEERESHVNEVRVEDKMISGKDSGALDERPSKRIKLENTDKLSDVKDIDNVVNSGVPKYERSNAEKSVAASGSKAKTGYINDLVALEREAKPAKYSSSLERRPSKRPNVDNSIGLSEGAGKTKIQKLDIRSGAGKISEERTTFKDKEKSEATRKSIGLNKSSSLKEKLDEKEIKFPNTNMPKSYDGKSTDNNKRGQRIDVTRRPIPDSSKWFKALPWEQKMQSADEQGSLVLLSNLDPEYTSGEVEDIIWHAFKEVCTAKMVQHSLISSPHSGRALVALKSKEVAERVIRKLDDECLMISNGRPLVGCKVALPKTSRKLSAFTGHLSVDKIKLQREMKEAVSTSHCSQPNTIEYEMAMEWCLLQQRSDVWWKSLYKRQGEDLRKIVKNLKSK